MGTGRLAWIGPLVALAGACGGASSSQPAEAEPAEAAPSEAAPAEAAPAEAAPEPAGLPPCEAPDPAATKLTDYAHASKGQLYWVEVEHHARYDEWMPAEHIDMPMHHASRLDWRNLADYPQLADATDARLRFTFELVSEDIEKVPRRHEWRATYGARIVGVCEP